MAVVFPGFIGGSNRVRSINVNAERTINWFPERDAGSPKVAEWLVPTPGLEPFVVLGDGPVRALFYQDGRMFAVGGTGFYEVFASQTTILRGLVPLNANPATISSNGSNGNQLYITSGGENYIYDLTANTLTLLGSDGPTTPTRMGTFSDGYFIALKENSNEFQISPLYDGSVWDILQTYQVSTVSDQVVALVESHRDLWLLGSQTSSVWSNTGDADIVYAPVPSVKIDMGCAAAFSAVNIDNTIFWLGQNANGSRIVWRANGYTPQRISTHAVEYALGQADRVNDAIAYAYQEEGHTFYVLYVPDLANHRGWGTTWVYDVATDQWHERALWTPDYLDWQPHPSRCHAYGFDRHLVGDRASGAIYTMDLDLAADTLVVSDAVAEIVPPDDPAVYAMQTAVGSYEAIGYPLTGVVNDEYTLTAEAGSYGVTGFVASLSKDGDEVDTVLQPGQMTFLGYYKFPTSNWNMVYGAHFLALREYDGAMRVYTDALDGSPATKKFLEYTMPIAAPSMSIASAPQLTYVADHGDIWANTFAESGVRGDIIIGGGAWDATRSGFWFTNGDPYGVNVSHYPTLSFVSFSGGTKGTVYGPWRQEAHPNMTCGQVVPVPSSFQGYLSGMRFGIVSGSGSGIATRTAGNSMAGFEDINPLTLPAATMPNPPYVPGSGQIESHWAIQHDGDHPQTRDTRYKVCTWWQPGDLGSQNYNCVINNHINAGTPLWGGRGTPAGYVVEDDSTSGACWVETPVCRGVVFGGQLVTTPIGYTAPGSDPIVHAWYGDPTYATSNGITGDGYQNGYCCHNQPDPWWGATGPGTNYKVPHFWIYAYEELQQSATGAVAVYEPTPSSTTQLVDGSGDLMFPDAPANNLSSNFFRSPVFDPTTNRVYAVVANMDGTSVYGPTRQPVIAVWEVAS